MYIRLTPEREFTVRLATRLLPFHGDALSAFERQLVAEIVDRYLSPDHDVPPITDAEWPVLEEAAQVMATASALQRRAA
ncbi:hypothetical protein [Caulobacter sp. BP25]|uniref:hypothetical protein n=1 Tax=Caulobacter sp. BP25 TaxID=2048900 RepID=UPI000C12D3CC|nr:hypothetical protein [Caulobacter sp. BP25]PHY20788.1 hypothetical protein CSW59_06075 [Caulobacter sp. BP25]